MAFFTHLLIQAIVHKSQLVFHHFLGFHQVTIVPQNLDLMVFMVSIGL